MGTMTNTWKGLVTNSDMKGLCERNVGKLKCKAIPVQNRADR